MEVSTKIASAAYAAGQAAVVAHVAVPSLKW